MPRYAILSYDKVIDFAEADVNYAQRMGWVAARADTAKGDEYDRLLGQFVRPPAPAPDLKALREAALVRVNSGYEQRTLALSESYPPSERESWPVQTSEAHALLADEEAPTPWIDAASRARGIPKQELARRIVALDEQYRAIHGTLSGKRQRMEEDIQRIDNPEIIAVIDWPKQ